MATKETIYTQRWKDANIDRMTFSLPKGKKELLRQYAESQGKTVSSYLIDLIEKDSGLNMRREKKCTNTPEKKTSKKTNKKPYKKAKPKDDSKYDQDKAIKEAVLFWENMKKK